MSKASKSDVGPSVNKELRKKTLEWAADREELQLGDGKTDMFICQLYEILATGSTHHVIQDRPMWGSKALILINKFREVNLYILYTLAVKYDVDWKSR